jgi:hypothetical protein
MLHDALLKLCPFVAQPRHHQESDHVAERDLTHDVGVFTRQEHLAPPEDSLQ